MISPSPIPPRLHVSVGRRLSSLGKFSKRELAWNHLLTLAAFGYPMFPEFSFRSILTHYMSVGHDTAVDVLKIFIRYGRVTSRTSDAIILKLMKKNGVSDVFSIFFQYYASLLPNPSPAVFAALIKAPKTQMSDVALIGETMHKLQIPHTEKTIFSLFTHLLRTNEAQRALSLYAELKRSDIIATDRIYDVLFQFKLDSKYLKVFLKDMRSLYLLRPLSPIAHEAQMKLMREEKKFKDLIDYFQSLTNKDLSEKSMMMILFTLADLKQFDNARKFFYERFSLQPNIGISLWNCFLKLMVEDRQHDEVMGLYRQLSSKEHPLGLTALTIFIVMKSCSLAGDVSNALLVYSDVERQKIALSPPFDTEIPALLNEMLMNNRNY